MKLCENNDVKKRGVKKNKLLTLIIEKLLSFLGGLFLMMWVLGIF